jgi:hypothetical protein
MIGLAPGVEHFFMYISILVLFNLTSAAQCMVIGASTTRIGLAIFLAVLVTLLSMVFGGFLANTEKMPIVLQAITYLSMYKYAFEAAIINDVADATLYDTKLGIGINVRKF